MGQLKKCFGFSPRDFCTFLAFQTPFYTVRRTVCVRRSTAMALKNMLGLVCDPVAGLVETPCIKRNAAGAANAVVAAQMALAGIQSVIPPDEIIDAMYEIGCQLPACLRETSQAGLATTPTGQKIAEKLGQNQF